MLRSTTCTSSCAPMLVPLAQSINFHSILLCTVTVVNILLEIYAPKYNMYQFMCSNVSVPCTKHKLPPFSLYQMSTTRMFKTKDSEPATNVTRKPVSKVFLNPDPRAPPPRNITRRGKKDVKPIKSVKYNFSDHHAVMVTEMDNRTLQMQGYKVQYHKVGGKGQPHLADAGL